ncbi:MAG: glycosyltransferase family 2 protein [Coriobacteriales bacterium]|jgi:GT2 family glycosyltransferase|nr:glycosyltransferase family 2 protein [Coriobacteriales bacterium]
MTRNISASIVTFNNVAQVSGLLDSMQRYADLQELELFVIDNASSDGTAELLSNHYPWVKLLSNTQNRGFGAAHNQVLPLLPSRYHVLINPDIVFTEDALTPLFSYLDEHPETAMITPRILNSDGSEQKLPKLQPRPRYVVARRFEQRFAWAKRLCSEYVRADEDFTEPTEIENCTGSFCVIRTEIFRQINGFDECFFLYFEDNDLSLRAHEHGNLIFYPQAAVVHHYRREAMSSTRAFLRQIRSMLHYFNKHGWT